MQWFYAEDIINRLELDPNMTFVPIGDLCAKIGMNPAEEERRIREHHVFGEGVRRIPIETDTGEMLRWCLRVELLPAYLLTIDANRVTDGAFHERLLLFQREAASLLWQAFRPQGFDSSDELLPDRHNQSQVEQAYVGTMAAANLARQQMLIERQLDQQADVADDHGNLSDPWAARAAMIDDPSAARLAQTARRVAQTLAERTRRNEYWGVYLGLYRNFGISSYRRMHGFFDRFLDALPQ
jgi:hypothetical protein